VRLRGLIASAILPSWTYILRKKIFPKEYTCVPFLPLSCMKLSLLDVDPFPGQGWGWRNGEGSTEYIPLG
jgi:hypothetical protein